MATLAGNSASYFWSGVHADRPDPTNVAPNTVCRAFETDTQTWWSGPDRHGFWRAHGSLYRLMATRPHSTPATLPATCRST